MIEHTEDHIFVEVSQIVSIPREHFSKENWEELLKMDEDEISDLMEIGNMDLDVDLIENLHWNLNNE